MTFAALTLKHSRIAETAETGQPRTIQAIPTSAGGKDILMYCGNKCQSL